MNDKTNSRFSSKEYKEKKKKKVKKLAEMSDSEVDVSLNKIVIQRSSLEPFVIQAEINNRKFDFELDSGSPVSTLKESEVKGMKLSPANVRLEAYNGSTIKVKGSIHFSNFLCNDILLNNVKFLVVDKSYPNNLLGRDLIEKLNLFPAVKNVKLNKFEDVVNNYKIGNSRPIKIFEAELYPKPDHFHLFRRQDQCHLVINQR